MTYAKLGLDRTGCVSNERKLIVPVLKFLGVLIAYAVSLAVLIAGNIYLSLAFVPISGMLIVVLFVIGHDACHQSYPPSQGVNNVIGRIAFLPALQAYSLWEHEHNRRIIVSTTYETWIMPGFQ